mmetsp:Transcript_45148/g.98156  ORF Transcript_45148/g.98156 Transcript_45148/m.98156 type:complete len:319 (-) Transcript_45148:950-1906(-)
MKLAAHAEVQSSRDAVALHRCKGLTTTPGLSTCGKGDAAPTGAQAICSGAPETASRRNMKRLPRAPGHSRSRLPRAEGRREELNNGGAHAARRRCSRGLRCVERRLRNVLALAEAVTALVQHALRVRLAHRRLLAAAVFGDTEDVGVEEQHGGHARDEHARRYEQRAQQRLAALGFLHREGWQLALDARALRRGRLAVGGEGVGVGAGEVAAARGLVRRKRAADEKRQRRRHGGARLGAGVERDADAVLVDGRVRRARTAAHALARAERRRVVASARAGAAALGPVLAAGARRRGGGGGGQVVRAAGGLGGGGAGGLG